MEVAVYNIEGTDTGKRVNLAESVFALETPNDHAIYLDVRQIHANRRQGTHKAKERGEISGTGKKPFRQKGTGNARQGDRKSPLWRHGGRVFGPRPRNYGFQLNKKVKALARRSALTYKAREESIRVLENFTFDSPSTKSFLSVLSNMEISGKKVLFVTGEVDRNVYLSGRNLPKTQVVPAADLNTYDILNAEMVVLTEDAVNVIHERLVN
ncbi:MAG: 50S ribosomal protein L4 [Bacteroidetes bacterium]|nr:MAG: 50S ribosomal protein L4 [Bacteroidota bacterium]